jgi:hypothetical protein
VGEWSDTTTFEVLQDPRLDIPQDAMDEQYELAKAIWEELSRSHDAIRKIRDVRGQVEALAGRADDEAVTEMADAITGSLTSIEEQLHQVKSESSQDILNFPPQIDNQLLYLQDIVEKTLGEPLPSSRERFAELQAELDGHIAELDAVIADQLPDFERLLEEADAPRVAIN